MPSRCTAYKCSNNSNDGYALVRYPQNESLRQKWIAAVGRGKSWSPNNTQQLCEIHFQPSEIKFVAGRKQVKLGAVPSRFCTCSIRKKRNILHLHQDGCVQTCKPLTKENLQPTTSQEIAEQMDEMQPMDENANSSRSIIIKENEQLRNEMKGTVEEVVKVIEKIVEYIKENENCKIITMAGAGISTSAGIPDFRSPSSGLYHKLDKYNLPHPQAIFELEFFMKKPEPFFTLARESLPEGFKPTISHYFIRLLWEKGLLLRHYTQNIDTLERVAGLPSEKLVEAHGTFHTGHCLKCRAPYTLPWMKEKIIEGAILKCEECDEGVVKPDIVFFGEMLPERFQVLADRDFVEADLLIIMGSSLVVQPFASLVDSTNHLSSFTLINNEKVGMQDRLSRFLGLRQGLVFDGKSAHGGRDVAWLGDCDTGCQLLADKLGWGDELQALMQRENESLKAEDKSDN